jgi:predicted outer membrane repeat protein
MILNGNVFSSNIASNKGGAVFVANKNVTLGQNANTFVSNTAFYGDIFAYAP